MLGSGGERQSGLVGRRSGLGGGDQPEGWFVVEEEDVRKRGRRQGEEKREIFVSKRFFLEWS